MKITMLGTGHAMVSNCYNTCFIMEENRMLFLTDTGGGYEILPRIKKAGYKLTDIHDIFITHRHSDHITGLIWILRSFIPAARHDDNAHLTIYGNKEVIEIAETMGRLMYAGSIEPLLNTKLFFKEIRNGETVRIIGNKVTFFNTNAKKVLQYGFVMTDVEGRRYVCCGDEPLYEENFALAMNCRLLMHEAFCLEKDEDTFKPHQKKHSTVSDAARTAEKVHAHALLLYHTEDSNMQSRKKEYSAEAAKYYSGQVFVPDDLEYNYI